MIKLEYISCPLCGCGTHNNWAKENGYNCVKCAQCGLLFVNPRPDGLYIEEAENWEGMPLKTELI